MNLIKKHNSIKTIKSIKFFLTNNNNSYNFLSFNYINYYSFCTENENQNEENNKPILTHTGANKMVNIRNKESNLRYARVSCIIQTTNDVINLIEENTNNKGDVLRTAEIAGIMASKRTHELIPLCHQLQLNTCKIKIEIISSTNNIHVESYVEAIEKTGVEMEAMVSCSITANTIYDMCKAVDKGMIIKEIKLIEKYGGKSGHYKV